MHLMCTVSRKYKIVSKDIFLNLLLRIVEGFLQGIQRDIC